MVWVLIDNNIVVAKSNLEIEGFIEVNEDVYPDMIASVNNGVYSFATPEPTQSPVIYPTEAILEDRATGELYEGFVENGVWVTEPLGENNG